MSIKEFFAFSVLKQSVIEFLKNKAEYSTLGSKYKKAFRGQIFKADGEHNNAAV